MPTLSRYAWETSDKRGLDQRLSPQNTRMGGGVGSPAHPMFLAFEKSYKKTSSRGQGQEKISGKLRENCGKLKPGVQRFQLVRGPSFTFFWTKKEQFV